MVSHLNNSSVMYEGKDGNSCYFIWLIQRVAAPGWGKKQRFQFKACCSLCAHLICLGLLVDRFSYLIILNWSVICFPSRSWRT